MFRLVGYDKEVYKKADSVYLRSVASRTIAAGLRFVYEEEWNDFGKLALIMCRLPEGFFEGFATYVGMDDDMAAGIAFVKRKAKRMIQKVEDIEEEYTFDVFEELLFAMAIDYVREEAAPYLQKTDNPFEDKKREAEVAAELVKRFEYKAREAKRMAREVLRFHKMLLEEDEDENLFFWDYDYQLYFSKSLIEGIRMLESFVGDQCGYGYEYTCEIFTDIGMKVPLLLVGTSEGVRIANEEKMKKAMELISEVLPEVPKDGKDLGDDENLPFS